MYHAPKSTAATKKKKKKKSTMKGRGTGSRR